MTSVTISEKLTPHEISNVIDSVRYNIQGISGLLEQRENLEQTVSQLNRDIEQCDKNVTFLGTCRDYYTKAVDKLYEESIGSLKETLNSALQYIMYDKDYECNIELENSRGNKTLDIFLIDKSNGGSEEIDLKDGTGQGVRAIISFVLKVYYLINKDSKLLFLDEKYSAISEHYVERFFEFMKALAKEKGIIVVMITHDNRFSVYADNTYTVNDGNVVHVTEEEGDNG